MHESKQDKAALRELQRRQRQRLEAPVEDLRAFFGLEADRLATLTMQVNIGDFLMAQRALAGLLADWRVEGECRYRKKQPGTVERRAVEVAPERYDFVIKKGRQFWRGPAGERLVTDLVTWDERRDPYCDLIFRLPQSRYGWLTELIPRLNRWVDEHHFLRGQTIDAFGQFISFERPVGWEDVFLPPDVRRSLERNCVELLRRRELYKANDVPLKRGILLHGPPGTGKTMVGKALAHICEATFILASPGMLGEPADVRRVFDWGRRFAPSILFFEDFDLVAGSRNQRVSYGILGEFLSCLDGLSSSEGVIVVATTNDLEAIEPALKDRPNRFDCILEIPPLAKAQRAAFLEKWRRERDGGFDAGKAAERTGGFTGAQLQELCRLAVQVAVEQCVEEEPCEARALPIDDACFARALERLGVKAKRQMGFAPSADT